jgi:putative DNA primase/helicase
MSDFLSVMEAHGLNPPKNIEPGRFFRFPGDSKNKGNTAGWCMLFPDGQGGVFGDFSKDLSETWQANGGRAITPAERAAFRRQVAEARKQFGSEQRAKYEAAAKKATEILTAATGDPANHPYAIRKKVYLGKLTKRGRWPQRSWPDALLLPIYDPSGKIVTIQAINADGTKDLLSGGKKKGCFYPLGKIRAASKILIGEGLATVGAGCEATGFPGVVAIDAGNLLEVSKVVREMAPEAEIIFLADDDQGRDNNTGINAATKAAKTVNGKVAFPGMDKKADFWDLFNEKGQEEVISAIKTAKPIVIDWAEPILFDDLNTPQIPARLLPKEMANFTAALAETTETPEALAVMSVLGIISVVAAKRFVVCPIDGWREPVNIYMAVILPPGNNKSFVLNNALSPLIKWERQQE